MAKSTRRFKDGVYEQLSRVGKAISAPKRLELLDLLCQGPRTVESLAGQAAISVANASQHLQVLRAARLVDRGQARPVRRVPAGRRRGRPVLRDASPAGDVAPGGNRSRDAEVHGATRRARSRCTATNCCVASGAARSRSSMCARPRSIGPGTSRARFPSRSRTSKTRLQDLPKDREVIAYCRGPYCVMAVGRGDPAASSTASRLIASNMASPTGAPEAGASRRAPGRHINRAANGSHDDGGSPRPAREPGAVLAARRRQRVRRRDGRHGAHHPAADRRAGLPPRGEDRGALVHRRLRRHQGADELPRGTPLRSLRPQARARRRLARRGAGAVPADVGADAGRGCSSRTRCSA